ncbi:uncharacterized protein LOC134321620 [Trichomycterus rosablanca]|uniref:uncharacterized protein LOC134321620 n=1 Tax=Trichomycterus rosablanca TaxID=2290929 RepID=UPI002F35C90D
MQHTAFDRLRKELASPTVLAQYRPQAKTKVSADASSFGLGAVLVQRQDNIEWRPVAYISRSLSETEQRYAQVEKEALAVTWACERLSSYLIGLQFTIETDHKPLIVLLGTKALDDLPPRIQRFRLRLLRFTYSIVHVPGKALITADTLSRAPIRRPLTSEEAQLEGEVQVFINTVRESLPASPSKLQQIAEHQQQDVICSQLILQCKRGWPRQEELPQLLKPYWVHQNYDFGHVTSSPYFAQSNGEAERAVKTVKGILKKKADPYRALLAYRVTPLHQGPSPAELLMGRRLRSPLPVSPGQLKPRWPNRKAFAEKDKRLKHAQTVTYNYRHRASARPELKAGQRVWITNTQEPATVLREADTPRSYVVETDSEEVRRNKAHLRLLPDLQTPPQVVEDTEQQTAEPEERTGERSQRAHLKREVKAPGWLKDYIT